MDDIEDLERKFLEAIKHPMSEREFKTLQNEALKPLKGLFEKAKSLPPEAAKVLRDRANEVKKRSAERTAQPPTKLLGSPALPLKSSVYEHPGGDRREPFA